MWIKCTLILVEDIFLCSFSTYKWTTIIYLDENCRMWHYLQIVSWYFSTKKHTFSPTFKNNNNNDYFPPHKKNKIIMIISKAQILKKPSALYKEHDGSGGAVKVQTNQKLNKFLS